MKNLKLKNFTVNLWERKGGDVFDIAGTAEKRLEKFMKENEVVPEIGDIIGDYDLESVNPEYSNKQYKVIEIEWVITTKEINISITVVETKP